jgi:hypothetical protein
MFLSAGISFEMYFECSPSDTQPSEMEAMLLLRLCNLTQLQLVLALYLQHNLFLENTSIYYNEKPRHEVSLV